MELLQNSRLCDVNIDNYWKWLAEKHWNSRVWPDVSPIYKAKEILKKKLSELKAFRSLPP